MKWKHKKEIEERFLEVKENKGDISWYLENSYLISYYDDTLDSIWHIGLRLYYFYNYFYKKHKRNNKKESIIYPINSDLINKFKGEISTTQTGYVPLMVKCIIDSSKVDFTLYEYDKYSINELYSFELNIKDPAGYVHNYRQFYFHGDMKDSIIKVLSMEGKLKASVRFSENNRGRLGKFIIEGTSYLPKMLSELENKD
jgi:hypothetical protein